MSTDAQIDEKIRIDVKEPSKYKVVFLNDNETPIDWVIAVLKDIFKHNDSRAEALTMMIHNEGSAVVGTYKYEVAEQKTIETTSASRSRGFPLQVKLEEE